jgi:hypothetical protein
MSSRVYDARSHRALPGGSIEVEGRWSAVSWIALGLLALLPLVARSPFGLGIVAAAAVYLYLFPPRRRVLFDARRRALRIEHAGLFSERGVQTIPFADLTAVIFQPAGRRGGSARYSAYARTREGRVYLFTHAGERATATLDGALHELLSASS